MLHGTGIFTHMYHGFMVNVVKNIPVPWSIWVLVFKMIQKFILVKKVNHQDNLKPFKYPKVVCFSLVPFLLVFSGCFSFPSICT